MARIRLPQLLNHRVDVLEELKDLATKQDGPGKPCELVLNTKVTGCVSASSSES